MNLKIKLFHEDSILPKKANPQDAAFDCYVHSIECLDENRIKVGLGFGAEVPNGYMLNIVPRSSISKTNWVLSNSYGVVDSGYCEEIFAVFTTWVVNVHSEYFDNKQEGIRTDYYIQDFPYKVGDRCCQFFMQPILETNLIISETISGKRSGFGSTGK
jgi:dUTPase